MIRSRETADFGQGELALMFTAAAAMRRNEPEKQGEVHRDNNHRRRDGPGNEDSPSAACREGDQEEDLHDPKSCVLERHPSLPPQTDQSAVLQGEDGEYCYPS